MRYEFNLCNHSKEYYYNSERRNYPKVGDSVTPDSRL